MDPFSYQSLLISQRSRLLHAAVSGRQWDALGEVEEVIRVKLLFDRLQARQVALVIGLRIVLQIGINVIHVGIAWMERSHGVVKAPDR